MVRCNLCGIKIKKEDFSNVYQISYGKLEGGNFIVGKDNTLYYHIECLDKSKSDKSKPIIVSEAI